MFRLVACFATWSIWYNMVVNLLITPVKGCKTRVMFNPKSFTPNIKINIWWVPTFESTSQQHEPPEFSDISFNLPRNGWFFDHFLVLVPKPKVVAQPRGLPWARGAHHACEAPGTGDARDVLQNAVLADVEADLSAELLAELAELEKNLKKWTSGRTFAES